ncbi:PREDICTED: NADH dehydrogenase [ubiquinone] 1 beta subcomplex subunit 3-like [Priapulus caudatus]|uniref:NADH dehydrogenase [ubiquinone] 1 beta subcomplex subunit 3 n=1 Tax=Priapulus caudatus TaxID=37621 RepID=A0ABM1E8Z9_PRICU|nr:PREDICTED: NADH dehydrogenase [ubiquinone] 1 beta subcomplex subunit 3-like [Priapulus caudatus]
MAATNRMGGGHHQEIKVPDWRIYKVADAPKLAEVEQMLASKGLKDPWLRNEVWRYHPGYGTPKHRFMLTFFRGFKYGFAAFVLTVAGRTAYEHYYPDEHAHH